MKRKVSDKAIQNAAMVGHEANRAWCEYNGDYSQESWDDTSPYFISSSVDGARGVANGNGPEDRHESWFKNRTEEGWAFGPVKDVENKKHPDLVPYSKLPAAEKIRDRIFVGVVNVMLDAFDELSAKEFSCKEDAPDTAGNEFTMVEEEVQHNLIGELHRKIFRHEPSGSYIEHLSYPGVCLDPSWKDIWRVVSRKERTVVVYE